MAEQKKQDLAGCGCLIVVAIIVGGSYGAYMKADDMGWISHTRDTVITAEPNWLVGESKTCYSTPVDPTTAKAISVEPFDVTRRVSCDNGPEHQIKITFFGRTERPEPQVKWGVSWKCTKNTGSFTCNALE